MSHHFDTPTAQEDPRINVCDFYLFDGRPGTTAMALTVNPDAGLSAPDTFRDEALYAFRFDLDDDAREDLTFKIRFGAPTHGNGDHAHVQTFEVRRARGSAALKGADGDLLIRGQTGEVTRTDPDVLAFCGLVPDVFAGDGGALVAFRNALFKENRFEPAAFQSRKNFFAKRNATAIVLEVPNEMIGSDRVHAWATASLYGHAPEVQVSRWGLPLITNIFIPDLSMREDFNRTAPSKDRERLAPQIGALVEKLTTLAASATNPADYAKRVVRRLCPAVLPYRIGTPASFDFCAFNGRSLSDDVMDVILTLATNSALGDGVAPDKGRVRDAFPYFGEPYTRAEQVDVVPARVRG